MGANQTCCASKQPPHKDRNNLQTVKPTRSNSVPYVLKEGTPAYESVVTPKPDKQNGYVFEKDDSSDVLTKQSSVSSEPQTFLSGQEEYEKQALLSKTLTTPHLDKDTKELASEQNWEHTQSLDTIELASIEQKPQFVERNSTIIEGQVKHKETRHSKSAEESSVGHDELLLNSEINQKEVSGTNSSSIRHYNIFDVEFRRYNNERAAATSSYSSHSSTYKEYYDSTPSPTNESPVTPPIQSKKIIVKAEIVTAFSESHDVEKSPTEDAANKLYSTVLKEGSLPRSPV